jgi:hypothetical protein
MFVTCPDEGKSLRSVTGTREGSRFLEAPRSYKSFFGKGKQHISKKKSVLLQSKDVYVPKVVAPKTPT